MAILLHFSADRTLNPAPMAASCVCIVLFVFILCVLCAVKPRIKESSFNTKWPPDELSTFSLVYTYSTPVVLLLPYACRNYNTSLT